MLNNLLNDFFEKSNYFFNRPVKDMAPYSIYPAKSGYILTVNTLGISKDDLEIKLLKQKNSKDRQLSIQGKTKIDKLNFENSINLTLQLKFFEEIEDLTYECKDGLTLIYLKTKKEDDIQDVMTAKFLEGSIDDIEI